MKNALAALFASAFSLSLAASPIATNGQINEANGQAARPYATEQEKGDFSSQFMRWVAKDLESLCRDAGGVAETNNLGENRYTASCTVMSKGAYSLDFALNEAKQFTLQAAYDQGWAQEFVAAPAHILGLRTMNPSIAVKTAPGLIKISATLPL